MIPPVASLRVWYAGIFLLGATILLFIADLLFGSVHIPPAEVWEALTGGEVSAEKYRILVIDSRLPRALTALLAGSSLAVCGLLMQTFFRNPVAGPYILGISSGASLGVALLMLGGIKLGMNQALISGSAPSVVVAAALGAGASMGLILLIATRVRDPATLLIFGLMLGSFTGAIVSVLQYFADRESLRDFIFWTFGSLDQTHWEELALLGPLAGISLVACWFLSRPFDLLALGDDYAKTMGLPVMATRVASITLTAILAGSVTAYCGPIAFIGVAVPHAARALSGRTSHRVLMPLSALGGAALLVGCDLLCRLPGQFGTLPINAVTALIGAPAVLAIIWRMRKIGQFFNSGS